MQDGHCNTAVGARRVVHIGDQRMFERLVAVDDEDHLVYVKLPPCFAPDTHEQSASSETQGEWAVKA